MGLFGKKKPAVATPGSSVIRTASYTYTPDFKGTKRKNITVYHIDTAEKGIRSLGVEKPSFIMTGRTITATECKGRERNKYLQILVDGHHIGNMYEWEEHMDLWDKLVTGKAEKVHIKFEQQTVIGQSRRKLKAEVRYQPYIFVK